MSNGLVAGLIHTDTGSTLFLANATSMPTKAS
jgi:hypothetical protein